MERPDTARMREKERHGLEERVMVSGSLSLSLPTGLGITLAISYRRGVLVTSIFICAFCLWF